MSFFPEPIHVSFDEDTMSVALDDGRTIIVPLAWYPRLLGARPDQLEAYELSPSGVHWDQLDEDISVQGMMAARVTFAPPAQAAE
ncbi:DUF2442 domain-containing protein [Sphingomonas sp.]|uniref:DUF2442 domain-containing protein n=1 Tax=Sphingomonas sp. TaxID=28214 RepID=UPI002DB9A889|nr:DUF2442 domain-containing protein [Sphingomonas sp.]HEU4968441.1 DUF2442 domain-containing protein [Sphingomonas sp.]